MNGEGRGEKQKKKPKNATLVSGHRSYICSNGSFWEEEEEKETERIRR